MISEDSGSRATVIREILQYVLQHPDAKDTLDGIRQFWLSSRVTHLGRDSVQEALDYLAEEKGWLIKRVIRTSIALYGLDKGCLATVRSFLSGSGAD